MADGHLQPSATMQQDPQLRLFGDNWLMDIAAITEDFQRKVCQQVRIEQEGVARFRVFTPFMFDDGDLLAVTLRSEEGGWVLTDEAHTYMQLSYDLTERDLHSGTRQKIISSALSMFQVEDRDGELLVEVSENQFGDALYSLVQAMLRISNVSYLSRERVRSAFMEGFKTLLCEVAGEDHLEFEWSHRPHDPEGKYTADCRINGAERPLLVFGLSSNGKTRDATNSLLQYEKRDIPFRSLAIFEDQETINRKVLARFSDVCDKQFSSLHLNRDRIERYVARAAAR